MDQAPVVMSEFKLKTNCSTKQYFMCSSYSISIWERAWIFYTSTCDNVYDPIRLIGVRQALLYCSQSMSNNKQQDEMNKTDYDNSRKIGKRKLEDEDKEGKGIGRNKEVLHKSVTKKKGRNIYTDRCLYTFRKA